MTVNSGIAEPPKSTSSEQQFRMTRLLLLAVLSGLLVLSELNSPYLSDLVTTNEDEELSARTEMPIQRDSEEKDPKRLKIAIISGFVTGKEPPTAHSPRVKPSNMGHLLNKACYSALWGYDYIFNSTWGFEDDIGKAYWKKFGTWHRVPHIQAALPHYDWVLYTDVDYYFRDFSVPLEYFIRDWEFHGHKDVSIFVPKDSDSRVHYVFSAFVVFIRNSPFGRRVVENWRHFAEGICPNGNFYDWNTKNAGGTTGRSYGWEDTDQPGLWYALAKTHAEFTNQESLYLGERCNNAGLINTDRALGPELNTYFRGSNPKVVQGHHEDDLYSVPTGQYIIWSKLSDETDSGLGIQKTFGVDGKKQTPHAFAIHKKQDLSTDPIASEMEYCRNVLGCYAEYDSTGILQLGCKPKDKLERLTAQQ